MLISLSGLDGAGKSTLIASLRQFCEERGQPAVVRHMNDDVGTYAVLRALRDRLRGPRSAEAEERSRARRRGGEVAEARERPASGPAGTRRATGLQRLRDAIVWSRTLRRCLYPIDLALFWACRLYHERLRGRVLIMDRYFYDTLVDVADPGRWFWVALLERFTPTPTVPVFLDVPPEVSFARKGEYSIEYLRERWAAYQAIARRVPSALHVANDDLAATQALLRNVVSLQLAAHSRDDRRTRRGTAMRLRRSGQ